MANDRLWILCEDCKEMAMLYKFYPLGFAGGGYLGDDVEAWIVKHANEHATGVCAPGRFRVAWENTEPEIYDNYRRRTKPE